MRVKKLTKRRDNDTKRSHAVTPTPAPLPAQTTTSASAVANDTTIKRESPDHVFKPVPCIEPGTSVDTTIRAGKRKSISSSSYNQDEKLTVVPNPSQEDNLPTSNRDVLLLPKTLPTLHPRPTIGVPSRQYSSSPHRDDPNINANHYIHGRPKHEPPRGYYHPTDPPIHRYHGSRQPLLPLRPMYHMNYPPPPPGRLNHPGSRRDSTTSTGRQPIGLVQEKKQRSHIENEKSLKSIIDKSRNKNVNVLSVTRDINQGTKINLQSHIEKENIANTSTHGKQENNESSVTTLKMNDTQATHRILDRNIERRLVPLLPDSPSNKERRIASNLPMSHSPCTCKKSKCLKLYCQCFSASTVCNPDLCKCKNCENTVQNGQGVDAARKVALGRNPKAFVNKLNSNVNKGGENGKIGYGEWYPYPPPHRVDYHPSFHPVNQYNYPYERSRDPNYPYPPSHDRFRPWGRGGRWYYEPYPPQRPMAPNVNRGQQPTDGCSTTTNHPTSSKSKKEGIQVHPKSSFTTQMHHDRPHAGMHRSVTLIHSDDEKTNDRTLATATSSSSSSSSSLSSSLKKENIDSIKTMNSNVNHMTTELNDHTYGHQARYQCHPETNRSTTNANGYLGSQGCFQPRTMRPVLQRNHRDATLKNKNHQSSVIRSEDEFPTSMKTSSGINSTRDGGAFVSSTVESGAGLDPSTTKDHTSTSAAVSDDNPPVKTTAESRAIHSNNTLSMKSGHGLDPDTTKERRLISSDCNTPDSVSDSSDNADDNMEIMAALAMTKLFQKKYEQAPSNHTSNSASPTPSSKVYRKPRPVSSTPETALCGKTDGSGAYFIHNRDYEQHGPQQKRRCVSNISAYNEMQPSIQPMQPRYVPQPSFVLSSNSSFDKKRMASGPSFQSQQQYHASNQAEKKSATRQVSQFYDGRSFSSN